MIIRLQLPSPPFLPPLPCSAVSTKCLLPSLSVRATTDTGLLFREKLLYLQDLNVDPQKALRLNPSLRAAPLSALLSVESVLSAVGLSRSAVGRILDMHPNLITSDPDADIYPVVRFLAEEIPISLLDIPKSLCRCPRLLVSSVDLQLRPALSFLNTLGFVGRYAINSRTTVLLVSSVEQTLIPKIEYLQSLGFAREEVANMVVRSPGLLTFSVQNNLVPKVEYFVEEMGGDVEELKQFPQYFSFSLERKIKPRHRLLTVHKIHMALPEMLKVSDGEFNARLIEMRLRSLEGRNL